MLRSPIKKSYHTIHMKLFGMMDRYVRIIQKSSKLKCASFFFFFCTWQIPINGGELYVTGTTTRCLWHFFIHSYTLDINETCWEISSNPCHCSKKISVRLLIVGFWPKEPMKLCKVGFGKFLHYRNDAFLAAS